MARVFLPSFQLSANPPDPARISRVRVKSWQLAATGRLIPEGDMSWQGKLGPGPGEPRAEAADMRTRAYAHVYIRACGTSAHTPMHTLTAACMHAHTHPSLDFFASGPSNSPANNGQQTQKQSQAREYTSLEQHAVLVTRPDFDSPTSCLRNYSK